MLQTRKNKIKAIKAALAALPEPKQCYFVGDVRNGQVCVKDEPFNINGMKVRHSVWQKPDGSLDHFYYDADHNKDADTDNLHD